MVYKPGASFGCLMESKPEFRLDKPSYLWTRRNRHLYQKALSVRSEPLISGLCNSGIVASPGVPLQFEQNRAVVELSPQVESCVYMVRLFQESDPLNKPPHAERAYKSMSH